MPPTGTVTLLFTDIEGSTRRWEAHTAAMHTLLARHDALLRDSIETYGGYVFKTVGDAFYATFATALDALEAALDSQLRLVAEDWGETGELRVRMALHTGAVESRDGDYFGPPLNRVARLLAVGHGGQVLLSAATQELVRDQLPAGAELLDLGEHRLKDLIRPERVFQLGAPDLPASFPRLRSLNTQTHNLPLQPTPFIGREVLLGTLAQRLQDPGLRLLTLTGPGGTGKTRLGLQVAAELTETFADGVFFVGLAPLSDPDLVTSSVAHTLGVTETGTQPLLETLQQFLADKEVLLLLDNFEQVLEAAPVVDALLQAAPKLKVLVTSRTPLHLYGEQEYAVPPLALPDLNRLPPLETLTQYEAVRLFIERAQAVKADFSVTNDNAPAVAEICARLDGLPLAIELAAARIRLFSPQALLGRLSSRLTVLTGGARNLSARQQTLRNTIDWSYQLLSPEEQTLFARLSVFVGGRSLEAAEAVCNPDGEVDVLNGIDSLVSKSLLRQDEGVDGEPRFVMLETLHEFASEKLDERGEAEELRERHAEFFLEFADSLKPQLSDAKSRQAATDRIVKENDNLRLVLEKTISSQDAASAVSLGAVMRFFWYRYGHFREGSIWSKRILAIEPYTVTTERAKLLHGAGIMAERQDQLDEASKYFEETVAVAQALEDENELASGLMSLGIVATTLGNYMEAITLIKRARALFDARADLFSAAQAGYNLGLLELRQGNYSEAERYFQSSLETYKHNEFNNLWVELDTANNIGLVALRRNQHGRAQAIFVENLAKYQESEDTEGAAGTLLNMGEVALQTKDLEGAATHFKESVASFRELGGLSSVVDGLSRLGLTLCSQRLLSEARDVLNEGLTLARQINYKQGVASVLFSWTELALTERDEEQAERYWREYLQTAKELKDKAKMLEGLELYARLSPNTRDTAATAAVLLGAASTLRDELQIPLPTLYLDTLNQSMTDSKGFFEPTRFETMWTAGRALSLEEAVALALGEDPPDADVTPT